MWFQLRIPMFCCTTMIAWAIAIVACANPIYGDDRNNRLVELGVRIVWGGNEPNSFEGEILHEDGLLNVTRELSLDQTGTIRKTQQPNRIQVVDPQSRFGGCDCTLKGKLDSKLTVRFKPELSREVPLSDPTTLIEAEFTLEQLVTGPQELPLGPKTKVFIDRLPGDSLRVSSTRASWVFRPGESLPIQVTPNLTKIKNQTLSLEWELVEVGDSTPKDRGSLPVTLDELGSSGAVSLGQLIAPAQPGVYELQIQLRPRRSLSQVFPSKLVERRVQLIVASPEPLSANMIGSRGGRSQATISWSESSIGKETLPGKSNPIANRPWGRVANNLRKLTLSKEGNDSRSVALEPRESLLLPINELSELTQYQFSFSTESSLDGIEVQISELTETNQEYRTRTLTLSKIQPTIGQLLTHSDSSTRKNYFFRFTSSGKRALIRITSLRAHGVITLSDFQIHPNPEISASSMADGRNEQAGAPRVIEYMTLDDWKLILAKGRSLRGKSRYDSWESVTQVLDDWLQLCKDRGVNSVAIPVFTSGAASYPSDRVLTNPLLDTGCFDSDGRDAMSKDLVHWMYIQCEKHQLRFIPVFEWNFSLRSFKNLQIKDDMWGEATGEVIGSPARWNPYHSEIQVEIKSILKEFERRYSKLSGYRGYAFHIGKESHLSLADSIEQISDPIVQKLLADQSGRVPNNSDERRLALSQLSGNAIHLKHQQSMLKVFSEWECDLNYIFTDANQSVLDLSQAGPAMIYVHTPGPNLASWIARRWWLEGFRPIAFTTNVMDSRLVSDTILPTNAGWLTTATPIESQSLQRRIDRIKGWRSEDSTKTAILNANPWETTIILQWSVMPQNLRVIHSECIVADVDKSPTARLLTIPANSLIVLEWDNPNASPYAWGTDESRSLLAYQSALQQVEAALNFASVPIMRNDLVENSDFDLVGDQSRGDKIVGWGYSLNPSAPVSLKSDSPHSGESHLRIACDKVGASAWLQSSPFGLQSNRLQVALQYRVQPGSVMNLQWSLFLWNENSSRFDQVSRRSASMDFSKRADTWAKWTEDFSEDLVSLGINSHNTFRLQLDVQGDCAIDLDSVTIATDYLLERERIEFRNTLFLARRSLTEGSSEAAYRLLDSSTVRTLLLWMKDAEVSGDVLPVSASNPKQGMPISAKTEKNRPPEPEKRAADRRWKLWNR
ncbi:hypothetical protein SH449x_004300 [Pirellulaceae bacterium SH449]